MHTHNYLYIMSRQFLVLLLRIILSRGLFFIRFKACYANLNSKFSISDSPKKFYVVNLCIILTLCGLYLVKSPSYFTLKRKVFWYVKSWYVFLANTIYFATQHWINVSGFDPKKFNLQFSQRTFFIDRVTRI